MSKTVVLEQELPSYLKDLFREDTKCRLVFCQPIITTFVDVENESLELDGTIEENVNATAKENVDSTAEENVYDFIQRKCKEVKQEKDIVEGLLQVDLDEGIIDIVGKSPQQKACVIAEPTTEEYHYPIEIGEARSLLGTQYNNVMSDIPTFCIIKDSKAKKKEKPVILGGQKTAHFATSYFVFSFGVQQMDGDSLKWDVWKKKVRFQPCATTEYTFRRIYHIYGPEMIENIDIEKNIASMVLETLWSKPVEDEPNFIETSMRLEMLVVSGHPDSSIHVQWNELRQLEKYMEILDDEKALEIGGTVISDNHSAASDLAENIHILCSNPIIRRKQFPQKLLANDLRELTILDRLWCILIRCKDLIDLKNCLSTFFRIAKIEDLVDRDRAVELLKALDIQDYIQNLSLSESLKFLVAIGCEKCKNDHLAIINFYNPKHQIGLEKIWSKYCEVKKQEVKRKSVAPNQPKYFALTDTTFNREKINLLVCLHDASEYVIFMKNHVKESMKLSDDNFNRISNEAYLKFVFNNENIRRSEVLKPKVVSITCDLDSKNEELYKNLMPVKKIYETKFEMKNNKSNKDESIHTILISKSPIFPKCICDDPVMVESNNDPKASLELENNYYVASLAMTKYGFF